MTEKTRKLRFIDENRTKGLQKDWQGYGKSQALFGIVVLMIFLLAFVYHFDMDYLVSSFRPLFLKNSIAFSTSHVRISSV